MYLSPAPTAAAAPGAESIIDLSEIVSYKPDCGGGCLCTYHHLQGWQRLQLAQLRLRLLQLRLLLLLLLRITSNHRQRFITRRLVLWWRLLVYLRSNDKRC